MTLRGGATLLLVLALSDCGGSGRPAPPQRLLETPAQGSAPAIGRVETGGDARAALLTSARWKVRLPPRGLLTYGVGVSWAGEGEAPGWFRLTVRAGETVLDQRTINPRATRGFTEVARPLPEGPRDSALSFELRFTDRDARDIPQPREMLLAVAEPTVHDLAAYGGARGVLLVSIDTLRRDHVGAYGYTRPTTPRLDRLAGEGILCEDAVSVSSWTLPAHASMLTSVSPGLHGGVDMKHGLGPAVPTLPEVLRRAGHATQAVTSHLYVSGVYGLDRGFDHLDFRQDRKAGEVADHAIALLDRLGDRPFFVFLHFYDPHWHYDPPEETRRLFPEGGESTITGFWKDFSRRRPEEVTEADRARILALYDGEIRYTDDQLARVLDHLRLRGLDRSTLVVVTSDHGEEFLEHGAWEHQRTLYEEVIRIPLLVRGPGIAPRRETGQASLLDVMPTVLDFLGLPAPPALEGRSLLRPLPERQAHGETDHTTDGTHKLFVRAGAGRWKAIFSIDRTDPSRVAEEWYDLAQDPGETHSARPAASLADGIRGEALEHWRRSRSGLGPPVQLTHEQEEKLRALGYVGP